MKMIKRYSIHLFSIRIILFFSLMFSASCTFDYFEDETNYVVYVPKASAELMTDEYKIEDIHIYIYNETLGKQKTATFPFQENSRMKLGNFNFRLFPGSYSTYCFANTEGMDFIDLASWQDTAFGLPVSDNGEYCYPGLFSRFTVEVKTPEIIFPGPVVTDTVCFSKRYSGRICVAFKELTKLNPLLTYSNIKSVTMEATGIGTHQRLSLLTDSIHTRSGCYSPADRVIMDCSPYENPLDGYAFGIDCYFFPSLSDESPITLTMDFQGHDGTSIHRFSINTTEILHTNQTIYLGTDGLSTLILDITAPEQWDPGIVPGDDEIGM